MPQCEYELGDVDLRTLIDFIGQDTKDYLIDEECFPGLYVSNADVAYELEKRFKKLKGEV